jgi:SAM-dependent methyltransferase
MDQRGSLMMDCRICGNPSHNRSFSAREMMFGLRHTFEYIECSDCGCLQISEVPDNLGDYYPTRYYAYEAPRLQNQGRIKAFVKSRWARFELGHVDGLGFIVSRFYRAPDYFRWLRTAGIRFDHSILDVGCGAGHHLIEMRGFGYSDLTGVDPFVEADITYPTGVRILSSHLDELIGQYDFIMLNHSLEHMSEPRAALRQVERLLRPGGSALIRVPVADSYAWRTYGANWLQLDPPRHLFVPTQRSIRLLAADAGLQVAKVVFDSHAVQFWGSEQYRMDIPLHDSRSYLTDPSASPFSTRDIARFDARSASLNAAADGDQACFFLKKPDLAVITSPG